MGDMNDISGSYTLRELASAGLTDAWWKGGCGYSNTFHDGLIRLQIDHILFDKKQSGLSGIQVIGDSEWGNHNSIIVGFEYKYK